MSISQFVRRPAVAGLWRRPPSRAAVTAREAVARPAAPPRTVPVLCLACTFGSGQADALAEAVLSRLAASRRPVGTVVLDLGSGAGLDGQARQALCELRELLRHRGIGLRLVVTAREERDALAVAADHRIGPDTVHDCARAAMLAAYAQVPGPGLVNAGVRAALAVPPDML